MRILDSGIMGIFNNAILIANIDKQGAFAALSRFPKKAA